MNVWNFTGRLGSDAETRFTPSGDPVVSFSVAATSGYGDKAQTTWARCSMFGRRGAAGAPYLTMDQQVAVSGELTAREWTNRDGLKRTSIEVRVNDVTLVGRRDDSGAQGGDYAPQQAQQSPQAPQRPAAP